MFPLVPEQKDGGRPVVLIPNPFYSVYPASAIAAGAEPYYVASPAETGFLPDFASVPENILKRTVAAFFCSPSNPEGACATESEWRELFAAADRYDFTVLADECYCEIYDDVAPIGATAARYAMSGGFERLLSFHSLSKRSSAPGLRSGFVMGPKDPIGTLLAFRNTSAPQVPFGQEASAACWADEAMSIRPRLYRERCDRPAALQHCRVRQPRRLLRLEGRRRAKFARTSGVDGVRVMPAYMAVESTPASRSVTQGIAMFELLSFTTC
jgi:aspartate/methionine/tyrosine aminotransferase